MNILLETAYDVLEHHSHLAAARRFLQIYQQHFAAGPERAAGVR